MKIKENKMKIKFSYLYRDGSNYKQFNEVVFSNPNRIELDKIEKVIRANLIDGCWFIAEDWGLRDLHFREYFWNNKIDHEWHEFEFIEETEEAATEEIGIDEFLHKIVLR